MVSPMHSWGESKIQPSTPCSASIECGGRRSTLEASAISERLVLRGAFLRSGAPPSFSRLFIIKKFFLHRRRCAAENLSRCADARERHTPWASNLELSESLHRMLARYPQQTHKTCPHFSRPGLPKTVIP